MRSQPPFDPSDHDYGAATGSVRAILRAWMAIDWLAPTGAPDLDGLALFRDHQARAHAFDRERVAAPETLALRVLRGGLAELAALCAPIRGETARDWKLGELKRLSRDHNRARGWSAEAYARAHPWPPRPGDLCVMLPNDVVIWTGAPPSLGLRPDDVASFYLTYAHGDLLDACQWQLARGDDDTSTNPFVPLLDGYARGFYPVSLDPATAVIFRFAAAQ